MGGPGFAIQGSIPYLQDIASTLFCGLPGIFGGCLLNPMPFRSHDGSGPLKGRIREKGNALGNTFIGIIGGKAPGDFAADTLFQFSRINANGLIQPFIDFAICDDGLYSRILINGSVNKQFFVVV